MTKTFENDINDKKFDFSNPSKSIVDTDTDIDAAEETEVETDPRWELKTKRFQMMLKPSLYNKLRLLAKERHYSMNGIAHGILEDYFNGRGA